jgi:hypothetical protein
MKRTLVSLHTGLSAVLVTLLLSGCGLAETGAVAATEAKAAADQAKQGKELEEKVQRDVEAAQLEQKQAIDKAEQEASQ